PKHSRRGLRWWPIQHPAVGGNGTTSTWRPSRRQRDDDVLPAARRDGRNPTAGTRRVQATDLTADGRPTPRVRTRPDAFNYKVARRPHTWGHHDCNDAKARRVRDDQTAGWEHADGAHRSRRQHISIAERAAAAAAWRSPPNLRQVSIRPGGLARQNDQGPEACAGPELRPALPPCVGAAAAEGATVAAPLLAKRSRLRGTQHISAGKAIRIDRKPCSVITMSADHL